MLQGHDENKELCWSNFKFYTVESEKFNFRCKVEIVSLQSNKNKLYKEGQQRVFRRNWVSRK